MLDYKAAIFDMDGTLIDSNIVWEKINKEYLAKRNISVSDDEMRKFTAMTFEEISEYFLNVFKIGGTVEDLIQECNEMVIDEYRHNIKLKPSAKEYLLYLKQNGIKIALATASSQLLYEAVLNNHSILDCFDVLSTTSEVERGKGFPDVYLLTAKKLNVLPEDCIVFEDILPGIKGAKAAGMRAYGVYDFYSEQYMEDIKKLADGYIYDFSEMM